eukprot:scaffold295388_cov62-Attheya_sp.AAC.1
MILIPPYVINIDTYVTNDTTNEDETADREKEESESICHQNVVSSSEAVFFLLLHLRSATITATTGFVHGLIHEWAMAKNRISSSNPVYILA